MISVTLRHSSIATSKSSSYRIQVEVLAGFLEVLEYTKGDGRDGKETHPFDTAGQEQRHSCLNEPCPPSTGEGSIAIVVKIDPRQHCVAHEEHHGRIQ